MSYIAPLMSHITPLMSYIVPFMSYIEALKLYIFIKRGVGGTVVGESALRSAGILQWRVRAPPPAPWPGGWPESLRSPCCGLAIYKNKS
ncbi:hypothetical protein PoB_003736200 [Plakobranchus ocellatus]|uniref:Uncharacterized protein n=1 Tax=Plakobranchus ocellatus TaxID=259542 RepID=A0AAV4AV21_9GAST|nr:hypothetical protein PoB_003736200 [Plakobranchus ocellatus]